MSDNPSKIKDIDLEIFKNDISQCIKPQNDNDIITELCSHCKRLCAASKYYDVLCAAKLSEEERKALLVEFMDTVYESVLDDTAHFIKEHEGELQQVWKEWTERYGFAKCSVSKCAKTSRHYGRGRRNGKNEKENESEDGTYTFYQSIFDRFHNYLAHLYQIGLRVDTKSLVKNGDDEKEDGDSKGVTVDNIFAAERDQIKSVRKMCDLDLDRFDEEINKFTIQSDEKMTEYTLSDALFDKLKEIANIERSKVHQLKEYLERNQFDSDAVDCDLEDAADSNIAGLVQSSLVINSMTAVTRAIGLRRKAFSTGFVFDYWTEGQPMSIKPKYKNLKQEIIESGHLTLKEWMQFVELKARRYLKMKRVKKMKSGQADMYYEHRTNTGHMESNQPLSMEHLCAIILYCDFGILCTAFSATYRLQNVFEDLESVKERHSSYGHFGKLLVEAVLEFGINGREKTKGHETGPYFCGINCVLNIGSYAIRLLGPCSTSTQRSVALNFAKSEGIILRLNNEGKESKNQCFFDCSWISNYFEEAERLWIAGKKPLKIESIAIVKTARNYKKMIHALYALDAMISGVDQADVRVNEYDLSLITKLFRLTLDGDNDALNDFQSYFVDEWDLFRQNKEEIRLDLFDMVRTFKTLSNLILFDVVCNVNKTAKGMDNVLKPEWISLFPAVHTVRINTLGIQHKFRLEALLETMKSLSPSVTVIVEDRREWAKKALTDEVSAAFKAEGWNMEYDDEHIAYDGGKGGLIVKSNV